MNKPLIILKDNLLLPILATETRISEIKDEVNQNITNVSLNGLFVMLVSYIESMQKEIITYYLKYRPDKILEKSIIIDKTTIIANEDFYLLESIVEDYISKMPYWQLSELFYKALGITKSRNENKIKTIKDKRNDLIHRNLEVNFKRKEIQQDFIGTDYLLDCLIEYEKYLFEMKSKIIESYAGCTKINALKNLWHYTFKTPLCASFSDYWYLDEEKDIINGCKHPEIESSLSSSEKFMLNVWRSQVCGCKVDFLNMASIGGHFQNCLYMFLKLSNDIFLYAT